MAKVVKPLSLGVTIASGQSVSSRIKLPKCTLIAATADPVTSDLPVTGVELQLRDLNGQLYTLARGHMQATSPSRSISWIGSLPVEQDEQLRVRAPNERSGSVDYTISAKIEVDE